MGDAITSDRVVIVQMRGSIRTWAEVVKNSDVISGFNLTEHLRLIWPVKDTYKQCMPSSILFFFFRLVFSLFFSFFSSSRRRSSPPFCFLVNDTSYRGYLIFFYFYLSLFFPSSCYEFVTETDICFCKVRRFSLKSQYNRIPVERGNYYNIMINQ